MNPLEQKHEQAMDFVEEAMLARRKVQPKKAERLLKKAFELERTVAKEAITQDLPEPSRSILLRSAATLALRCHNNLEAEKLVAHGLTGTPPEDIAEQLRDLLEEIHFARHLDVRGVVLSPEDVQLSLSGHEVGLGMAPADELLTRVDVFKKMFRRTAEHLEGRPYQEKGRSAILKDFKLFMSLPRAASFAVTLRIGRSKDQPELIASPAVRVVDEICERLRLFNGYEDKELERRIDDQTYFVNFLSLAKQFGPKGESVRQVGLTLWRDGQESRVHVTREKEKRRESREGVTRETVAETEVLTGTIVFADARKEKIDTIELRTDDGNSISIRVPKGMMTDVVKPFWDEYVRVIVRRVGKKYEIRDIELSKTLGDD